MKDMIIVCKKCGSNYYVDKGLLATYCKRKVRCASCGHTWLWENQGVMQDMPIQPPAFADDMFAPPQYQRVTPVRWPFYTFTFLIALMAMLILGHRYVRQYFPFTQAFYEVILPKPTLNQDFFLSNLRVEYTPHSKNNPNNPGATITGSITYKPQENIARTPPAIEVTFYERGTCPPKSWTSKIFEKYNPHSDLCLKDTWLIQPYNQVMMPGDQVPFEFSSPYKGSQKPDIMDAKIVEIR